MNEILENLKNKKIAIFGASGLIGSYMIFMLRNFDFENDLNLKIYAFCHSEASVRRLTNLIGKNGSVEILRQDVTKDVCLNESVDYVIHCASPADPINYSSRPVQTICTNVMGTNNILNWICRNGGNNTKFVYISSGEVYGEQLNNTLGFEENCNSMVEPLKLRNCYPIGKIASENLCVAYFKQYGIKTYIARLSHTYGPTISPTNSRADAQFLRNAIDHQDIVLKSAGEQVRSYCYVEDACIGLLYILIKGEPGEAYNVTNTKSVVSIRKYAEILASLAGVKIVFDNPSHAESVGFTKIQKGILDNRKLMKLGWYPKTDIYEGLRKTFEGTKIYNLK